MGLDIAGVAGWRGSSGARRHLGFGMAPASCSCCPADHVQEPAPGRLPRGAGRTERDRRSGAMWQRRPRGGKRGRRAGGPTPSTASGAWTAAGRQARHGLRRANHLCGRRQCSHRRCRGSKPSAASCRLWYQRGPAGRLSQGASSTADHCSDGGGEEGSQSGTAAAATAAARAEDARAIRPTLSGLLSYTNGLAMGGVWAAAWLTAAESGQRGQQCRGGLHERCVSRRKNSRLAHCARCRRAALTPDGSCCLLCGRPAPEEW